MKRKPTPVDVEELKAAILRMIVQQFGDRPLDVDTAAKALALAAFDLKVMALRTVAEANPPRVK